MAPGAMAASRIVNAAFLLLCVSAESPPIPHWAVLAAEATGRTPEQVLQLLASPVEEMSDARGLEASCATERLASAGSSPGVSMLQRAKQFDVVVSQQPDIAASDGKLNMVAEDGQDRSSSWALPALSRQPLGPLQQANDTPDMTFRRRISFVTCGILGLLLIWVGLRWAIRRHHELLGERPSDSDHYRLITVIVLVLGAWMLVGTMMFTHVVRFNGPAAKEEYLTVIEALYVSSQIITTVGYGDFTPARSLGQVFVACYIMFSAFIVGALVSEMFRILISGAEKYASCFSSSGNHAHPDTMESRAYQKLLVSMVPYVMCSVVGAMFFHWHPGEDKAWGEAFYMACVTLSSVGFGAFHPVTDAGRLFATLWMIIGVSSTGNLVLSFSDFFIKRHAVLRAEMLTKNLLADMGDTVTQTQFLWYELIRLGFTDRATVDEILKRFDDLDSDGNGVLDAEDLKALHLKDWDTATQPGTPTASRRTGRLGTASSRLGTTSAGLPAG